ncbi:MAG: 5-(carboxyamino)imidazole ribonucleotide mutase [Bacteroidia bacterium]
MSDIKVGIIMGSSSDLPIMKEAAAVLEELGVGYELTIVSAHRTPDRMYDYAQKAAGKGIEVIIAGAGGAAHLPGMVAAITPLAVIGVPIKSSNSIDGWDSVLSILQMPAGVPVATVALNGARNAGILAAQVVAAHDAVTLQRIREFKEKLKNKVLDDASEIESRGWRDFLKQHD